jgi:hypothetical protein
MKRDIFLTVALFLLTAQESRGPGCPVISVSQVDSASTDQTSIYKAYVQGGDALVTPKFNWTVWDGKITSGQGAAEVSVEPDLSGYASISLRCVYTTSRARQHTSSFMMRQVHGNLQCESVVKELRSI